MRVCECTVEHLNDLWIKARASFVLGWVYPCTRCSPLVHERIEDAARGLNVRPLRRQQALQPVGSTTQAQPRVVEGIPLEKESAREICVEKRKWRMR